VALSSSLTFSLHKATLTRDFTAGPLVLAAACPFLFLHADLQPELSLGFADATARLSDAAVLAVLVAALATGARDGFDRLRIGLPVLLPAAAFVLLIFASFAVPLIRDEPYDWQTHLVTALKFLEYALLAPALLLLVRRREDARPLLAVLVAAAVVAAVVALLQFSGAVSTWDGTPAGRRKPSLLGYHDYSALAGTVLALGLAGLAFGDRRRAWIWASLASGGLGVVLAGAVSGLAGVFAAAALLLVLAGRRQLLDLRRGAMIAAVLAVVAAGTFAIRSSALTDLAAFLGGDTDRGSGVQTYAHRTLLGYIGIRIFVDQPLTGVGWQGSAEEFAYGPYLDDAARRFPSEPPFAFPSPEHPWGVQNAYIQALADLGILGLVLLLAVFASAIRLGVRNGDVAVAGAASLLVLLGVWNGVGLVAGVPAAALTWLACGLAAVRD
jgi:O-antigen ligase